MLLNVPGKGNVEFDIPDNLTQEELDALTPEINKYIASLPDVEEQQETPAQSQPEAEVQTEAGAPEIETWEDYQAKVNFDQADLEKKKELFDTWRGQTVQKVEATGALSTATGISRLNDQFKTIEKAYQLNQPGRNIYEKYLVDPSRLKDSALYGYKTFELSEATEALEKATASGDKEAALQSAQKVKSLNEELAALPRPQESVGEIFLSKSILPNVQSALTQQMAMLFPKLATNSDTIIGQTAAGAGIGAAVGSLGGGVGAVPGAVTGARYGFRTGMATATGLSSYELEYSGQVLGLLSGDIQRDIRAKNEERLRNGQSLLKDPTPGFDGIDINDPEQLAAAYSNPELMTAVKRAANEKGVPVGFVDAMTALLTFGAASKFAKINKAAGLRGVGKVAKTAQGGTLFGTEILGGMGGETVSQYSAYGDITDPNAIYMEGALEIGGGAPVVGAALGTSRADLVQERLQNYAPQTSLALAIRDFRNQSNLSERIMGQNQALQALPFNYDRDSFNAINSGASPEEQQQKFNRTTNMVGLAMSEAHKILGMRPGSPLNISFSSGGPAFSFNPSKPNTITINPDLLNESLNTIDTTSAQEKSGSKMAEKRRQAYIISALAEEILHDVDLTQSRRNLYQQAVSQNEIDPNKTSFETWRREFGEKGAAEMTDKEKAETRRLYGKLDNGQELEGDALYSEFVRRLIQQKKIGISTEETWKSRAELKDKGSLLERSLLTARDYWQKAVRGLPGNSSVVKDHLKAINGLLNEKQKTESTLAKTAKTTAKTKPTEGEETVVETGETPATTVATPAQPEVAQQGAKAVAVTKPAAKQKPVKQTKPTKQPKVNPSNLKRFQARGKYGSVRLVFPNQQSVDAYDAGRRRDGKDRKKDSATLAKYSLVSKEMEDLGIIPKGKSPVALREYRQFIRDSIVKAEEGSDVNIVSFEEFARKKYQPEEVKAGGGGGSDDKRKTPQEIVAEAAAKETSQTTKTNAVQPESPKVVETPEPTPQAEVPVKQEPTVTAKKKQPEKTKVTGNNLVENIERARSRLAELDAQEMDYSGERAPENIRKERVALRKYVGELSGELAKRDSRGAPREEAGDFAMPVFPQPISKKIVPTEPNLVLEEDDENLGATLGAAAPRRETPRGQEAARNQYFSSIDTTVANREITNPNADKILEELINDKDFVLETVKYLSGYIRNNPIFKIEYEKMGIRSPDEVAQEALVFLMTASREPSFPENGTREEKKAAVFSTIKTKLNRLVDTEEMAQKLGRSEPSQEEIAQQSDPEMEQETEAELAKEKEAREEVEQGVLAEEDVADNAPTMDEKERVASVDPETGMARTERTAEWGDTLKATIPDTIENQDVPEFSDTAFDENGQAVVTVDPDIMSRIASEDVAEKLKTIGEVVRNILAEAPFTSLDKQLFAEIWNGNANISYNPFTQQVEISNVETERDRETGRAVPPGMRKKRQRSRERISKWMTETLRPRLIKEIGTLRFAGLSKSMRRKLGLNNYRLGDLLGAAKVKPSVAATDKIALNIEKVLARLPDWEPFWLGPTGEIIPVESAVVRMEGMNDMDSHAGEMVRWLQENQPEVYAELEKKYGYAVGKNINKEMMNRGWLRTTNDGNNILIEGKPGKEQVDLLTQKAISMELGLVHDRWPSKSKVLFKPGQEQVVPPMDLLGAAKVMTQLGVTDYQGPMTFKSANALRMLDNRIANFTGGILKGLTADKNNTVPWESLYSKLSKTVKKDELNWVIPVIKPLVKDGRLSVEEATQTIDELAKQKVMVTLLEDPSKYEDKTTELLSKKYQIARLPSYPLFINSHDEIQNLGANIYHKLEDSDKFKYGKAVIDTLASEYVLATNTPTNEDFTPLNILEKNPFFMASFETDNKSEQTIAVLAAAIRASIQRKQKPVPSLEETTKILNFALDESADSAYKFLSKFNKFVSDGTGDMLDELNLTGSQNAVMYLVWDDARKAIKEYEEDVNSEFNKILLVERARRAEDRLTYSFVNPIKGKVKSIQDQRASARWQIVNPKKFQDMEDLRDLLVRGPKITNWAGHFSEYDDVIGFGRMYSTSDAKIDPSGQTTAIDPNSIEKGTFVFEVQTDSEVQGEEDVESLRESVYATSAEKIIYALQEVAVREQRNAIYPEEADVYERSNMVVATYDDVYADDPSVNDDQEKMFAYTENIPDENAEKPGLIRVGDIIVREDDEPPTLIARKRRAAVAASGGQQSATPVIETFTMVGSGAVELRKYENLFGRKPNGITFMQNGLTRTMRAAKAGEQWKANRALVESHQSLVLKNAIANALERGEDFIALTDAETAAMTEGHQKIKDGMYTYYGKGSLINKDGKIVRKNAGVGHNILAKLTGDIGQEFNDGPSIEADAEMTGVRGGIQSRFLTSPDQRAVKRTVTGLKYSLAKFKDNKNRIDLTTIFGAAKINPQPSEGFMKAATGFNFPLRRMKPFQKAYFARKLESQDYWQKPHKSLRSVVSDFSTFEDNPEVLDFWNNLLENYNGQESFEKSILRLLNSSPIDNDKKLAATASLFKVPLLKTVLGESFITAPFVGGNIGLINKNNKLQYVALSEIVPDEAFAAANRLDAFQFASGKLPNVPKSGTSERVMFDESLEKLSRAESVTPEELREAATFLQTYIPSQDLVKYLHNEKKLSVQRSKDIVHGNIYHAAKVRPIDESEMDLINIGAIPFNPENPSTGLLTAKAAFIEGADLADIAEMQLFSDKELAKYAKDWMRLQVMEDGRVVASAPKEASAEQLTALTEILFHKKVPVFLNGKPLDYKTAIKKQAFVDTFANTVAKSLIENDLVMDEFGNIKSAVSVNPDFRKKMFNLFKKIQDFSSATEAYKYTIDQVLETLQQADLGLTKAQEMQFEGDMRNLLGAFEGQKVPMLVALLNDQVFPNVPQSIKDYLVQALPYFLPSNPSSEALNLIIQTKEFKDWFGKSSVTRPDGTPAVMYHVSSPDFRIPGTMFKDGGAKVYSQDRLQSPEAQKDLSESSNYGLVTPVFVKAKSPFKVQESSLFGPESSATSLNVELSLDHNLLMEKAVSAQLAKEIAKQTDKKVSEVKEIIKNSMAELEEKSLPFLANPKGFSNTFLQGILKKFGFDSIEIVPEEQSGSVNTKKSRDFSLNSRVIVFDPSQLKLANGFNTEFSSATPDILGAAKVTGFTYQLPDPNRFDLSKVPFLPRFAKELLGKYLNSSDKILDMRRFFQDRFIDLKKIQEQIEEQTGQVLPDSLNAYQLEELYHGKVGARLTDFNENVAEPILKKLRDSGIKLSEIERFMYALHAKERNERIRLINPIPEEPYNPGPDATPEERAKYEKAKKYKKYIEALHEKGSGMSDAEADEIIEQVKTDDRSENFEEARQMIREMIDNSLRQKLQEGLITQPLFDALTERYKDYVPLKGIPGATAEEISKSGQATGRGFNIRGDEVKPTLGRISKAENILAYAVNSAAAGIVRAEKNAIGNAIYELVQMFPDSNLWEIAEPEMIRRLVTRTNPETGESFQYARDFIDPTWMNNDDIFATKVNGETKFIRIKNKDLVRNLRNGGANPDHWSGKVLTGLATFMRLLSLTRTGLNPEFIFTNPLRDLQTAAANLSAEQYQDLAGRVVKSVASLKPLRTSIAEEFNPGSTSDEWGESYRAFVQSGGKLIGWMTGDIETQIKDINFAVDGESPTKVREYWNSVSDWIEKMNGGVENGTRLAVFHHARQMGATDQQAAAIARNATVNFTKKGEAGPVFNSLYLFFNASLQGSARLVQAMSSPKVRKLVVGIATSGLAASLFNEALGGDDEDGESWWSKVPEFKKRTNLIIMLPGTKGKYLSMPLPYGYNAFWHSGNIASDYFMGRKGAGQSASRLLETALEAFNPIGGARNLLAAIMPTIAQPVADIYTNQDWAGRPIVPSDFPGDPSPTPPSEKYFSSVSSLSKGITDTLNTLTGGNEVRAGAISWSPEYFDYFTSYFFGAVGSTFLRATSLPVKALNPNEEIGLNDIPLLRKFIGEQPSYADYERFATIREAVYTAKEEQDLLRQSGNDKEREKAAKKYAPELAIYPEVRSATGQMQKLKKRIDALREESDNTGIDRSKEIKELKEQKKEVVVRLSKAYKEALDRQKKEK